MSKLNDFTSITLTDAYGTYMVRQEQTDLSLDKLVDHILIPLLLACGYQRETIDEHLGFNDSDELQKMDEEAGALAERLAKANSLLQSKGYMGF
jgi:hypothetical protein